MQGMCVKLRLRSAVCGDLWTLAGGGGNLTGSNLGWTIDRNQVKPDKTSGIAQATASTIC